MLNITPLDIYIKCISAKSALRLKQSNGLKHDRIGHGTILQKIGRPIMGQETDYILSTLNFNRSFKTKIPTRDDWAANTVLRDDVISIYTDGSKTERGTGSGIFSDDLNLLLSLRLPDTCTVLQAEIYAIYTAARRIRELNLENSTIHIYLDSLASIKALNSNVIKSECLLNCIQSLAQLTQHHVELIWVPGHEGIRGNEISDECATRGSSLDLTLAQKDIHAPLTTLSKLIDEWALSETELRWSNIITCRISRLLWPTLTTDRTRTLLSLDKNSIRLLTGIITGHCMIGHMSERMGYPNHSYCRSCLDEEEVESVQHLLCDCPALQEHRLLYLGRTLFHDLDCLRDASLINMIGFIKSTGWFTWRPNEPSSQRN